MKWKTFFLQAFLTLIVVLFGVRFLSPDNTLQLEAFQKSIIEQIQDIKIQQGDYTQTGLEQYSSGLPITTQPARTGDFSGINQSLQAISQGLQEIKESLARLEDVREAPYGLMPPPTGFAADKTRSEGRFNSRREAIDVIEDLPDETRLQVQEIFREHANSFGSRFSAAAASGPQGLQDMLEKSDQQLKEKLRSVLSEEQYDNVTNSFPKPPHFGKPPPPKRPGS